jgi:DNA polymerase elongation subunit (family B)
LAEYTNAYENKMIMKREALCDTAIWTAKKRYILNVWNREGVSYAKPKIKISGLEAIKSSTPASCRSKIKEALDIILNKTENDMLDFIDDFRATFKTLPVSEVAFPRGVNGLDKYSDPRHIYGKKTPINVRGSLIYNHHLKEMDLIKKYPLINEGEKIKYLYLREPNILRSNIVAFPQVLPDEFQLENCIDYKVQYQKAFIDPLQIILTAIGWQSERGGSLAEFI